MGSSRRVISLNEFRELLKAQDVHPIDYAVKCCMCGTVQSSMDFFIAGVEAGDISKYLGFSCIGRFLNAGSPRKEPDGKPCNWTLGGLFLTHTMEVVMENGEHQPVFEPVTPQEAKTHAERLTGRDWELIDKFTKMLID